MAEERTSSSASEQEMIYRFTGNEPNELSIDKDMPWRRRLELFADITIQSDIAQDYLDKGVNKYDVYGDMKDIQDAVELLKSSADFHAKAFTPEQLREAADDPRTDMGLLAAVADRRAATERNSASGSLSDRIRAQDEPRESRQPREDERTLDEGRDEKG